MRQGAQGGQRGRPGGGGLCSAASDKGGPTGPDTDGLKCDEVPEAWASGSLIPGLLSGQGSCSGPRQHTPQSCAPCETRLRRELMVAPHLPGEGTHPVGLGSGNILQEPGGCWPGQGHPREEIDSVFGAVRGQEGGVLVSPGPLPGLQPCCKGRWKRCRKTFESPAKACPQNPWDWRVRGLGGGDGSRHPCKPPVLPCGCSQEHCVPPKLCPPQALGFPGAGHMDTPPSPHQAPGLVHQFYRTGGGGEPVCRQLRMPHRLEPWEGVCAGGAEPAGSLNPAWFPPVSLQAVPGAEGLSATLPLAPPAFPGTPGAGVAQLPQAPACHLHGFSLLFF